MKLTSEQVKHVAKLANLPLSQEEEELYSQQLSNILGYVEQLESIDTKDIEPIFNVSQNFNILAEDVISDSLDQQDAIKNAENTKDGSFVTKGVFASD